MGDEAKKVMMMLSIVEAEKGHKLIELLEKQEISQFLYEFYKEKCDYNY